MRICQLGKIRILAELNVAHFISLNDPVATAL